MNTDTLIARIDLPFFDLKESRKDTVRKECYLELFDTYLCYKVVGSYQSKNEDTDIWEYKKANYRWTRLRKNLVDISMYDDNNFLTWVVSIEFSGTTPDGTLWHHLEPKECLKTYEILKNYMVST